MMVQLMDGEFDNEVFGPLWRFLPLQAQEDARKLIVTLTLVEIASWDFRFETDFQQMPLKILQLLERPSDQPHDLRKDIANLVLFLDDEALSRECRFADVLQKSRQLHRVDWETIRDTGCIPPRLYAFLLLYRSRLTYQNQTVEGLISVMQRFASCMSSRAKRPGVSDKLRNKLGHGIALIDCVDLHPEVMSYLESEEQRNRWVPLHQRVPPEADPPLPIDAGADFLSKRYENTIRYDLYGESGLTYVWSLVKMQHGSPAFLICWSYGYRLLVCKGTIETNPPSFKFRATYPTNLLKDDIGAIIEEATVDSVPPTNIHVWKCLLQWGSCKHPGLSFDNVQEFVIRPRPQKRRPRRAPAAAHPPGDPPEAEDGPGGPDEDQEDQEYDDLGFWEAEAEGDEPQADEAEEVVPEDLDDNGHLLPEDPVEEPEQAPAPPPERGELQVVIAEQSIDFVRATVDEGFQQIVELKRRCSSCQSDAIRAFEDISLLRKPNGETLFVLWTNVHSKMARKISVNPITDAIITIVPARVPELCYADCVILIPRTGGRHKKGRHAHGETHNMPKWALHYRLFDSIRQFGGPWMEGDESLAPLQHRRCVVCVAAAEVGVGPSESLAEQGVWVCCHCWTAWHRPCANKMRSCLPASVPPKVARHEDAYPEPGSFACPVCVRPT